MSLYLTPDERAHLKRVARRPKKPIQRFRTKAILGLSSGIPIETVARQARVGVERVQYWLDRFTIERTAFIDEKNTGRASRRRADANEEDEF